MHSYLADHPTKEGVQRRLFFIEGQATNTSPTPFHNVPANCVAFWDFTQEGDTVYVHYVSVHPELRGKGIFSSIMALAPSYLGGRELTHSVVIQPAVNKHLKGLT